MDIKELVRKGKSQGYISYLDFKECLPSGIMDEDQIKDIMQMLIDMGIEIRKEKADVIWINSKIK